MNVLALKKIILLSVLLFLFSSFLQKNDEADCQQQFVDDNIILVFAGDLMGHSPQFKAAYIAEKDIFDYTPNFSFIKKYISKADYSFVNLEVTLAGNPYSGYPSFSSPDAVIEAVKDAGFNIVLTANNHVADRGKTGLERTLRVINANNLRWAGSYKNTNQRDSLYPLILNHKNYKIAVLNCTYGTNMNPVYSPNRVNMIDTIELKTDIDKAKLQKPDLILAVMHWGVEYQLDANTEQKQIADFLIRNNVKLVVGSHPHVVQNFENRGESLTPVVYSLGNFISNQTKENTNGGIVLRVEIAIHSGKISLSYLPVYVYRGVLNGKYNYYLIPTIDYIKNPSGFNIQSVDSQKLIRFDRLTRQRLNNMSVWDEY